MLIELTKGYSTAVDDEDYDELNKTSWHALVNRTGMVYAARRIRSDGKSVMQLMHRVLLNDPRGFQVDHEDHDTLNNQKKNLRKATWSQNQANSQKKTIGSSQYKGVYWHKARNKWVAELTINRKKTYIGSFESESDAARAYNGLAIASFGLYAEINKVNI